MANNVQIPAPFNKWYTINEAAEAMEYKHSQYVRKLLHDGKLGEYVEIETDSTGQPVLTADGAYKVVSGAKIKLMVGNVEQWRISPEACQAYKAAAAAGGGAFGQHAVRRMLFRFSTEHYTIEQIREALAKALGDAQQGEGDEGFRWEFAKAWKGGSKKKSKSTKSSAPVVATIVSSLTQADDLDDDEDFDEDYDDDDDEDVDDVLS